jgi:uncharacterized protein
MPSMTDLNAAIAAAMRARDQTTLDVLRMLKTAITMRGVEKGRDLDEPESLQVVSTLVKQRRDSIEQFTAAGRTDLAAEGGCRDRRARALPPAPRLTQEIAGAVDQAIAETGASGPRDIGKVMKAAMARLAGKTVDGKAVNEHVRARLR